MSVPVIFLATVSLLCLFGAALWLPAVAVALWIVFLETSPDIWLGTLTGGSESIIAGVKFAGIGIAVCLALRAGAKADRYNPSFAFLFMFVTGLIHGLYPGLTILSSLRSLIGSASPFVFGFVKLPASFARSVIRSIIIAPLLTVLFGAVLQGLGLHPMYDIEQGALRLGASGLAPFLAGFALVAIYAGLLELITTRRRADILFWFINFLILLATGARVPLVLAMALSVITLCLPATGITPRAKTIALAAIGALACSAVIFTNDLSFIRVFDLIRLGEASNLSHRNLVWPYFEAAFSTSPWLGWGVGAGKFVLPTTGSFTTYIGTNAAHNEYLRIGVEGGCIGLFLFIASLGLWAWRNTATLPPPRRLFMRLVFVAFAIHSATDNTLIATTGLAFFIWASAVFATRDETSKPAS